MKKELKGLYDLCKEKGLTDAELLPYFRTIESNLKTKRYGLVWEEQLEDIASDLKNKFPILVEREDLNIKADLNGLTNCLIEGDNYESLTFLKNSGVRVSAVYIDPPYNTGNQDFVYNDKYIDSEDTWRHSSWLSFMNKRLKLAKELLTEDGVIFISIDEYEYAQLKLLCDSVFGEKNFIANISWDKRNPKGNSKTISSVVEYILVYSRNKNLINGLFVKKENVMEMLNKADSLYKKINTIVVPDELLSIKKNYPSINIEIDDSKFKYTLEKANDDFYKWLTTKNTFTLGEKAYRYIDSDGEVFRGVSMAAPKDSKNKTPLLHPLTKKPCKIPKTGWRNNQDTMDVLLSKNSIIFGDDENIQPTRKYLLSENIKISLSDLISYAGNGIDDLTRLSFPSDIFDNPKPIYLIKKLLEPLKKDAVILDFFAGSGTTGHAVLELNKEDGGTRKFILCTNNEVSYQKELDYLKQIGKVNGVSKKELTGSYKEYQYKDEYVLFKESEDYAKLGICRSVTYERLKRVINGYTTPKGKEVEGIPANLKYFKVENLDSDVNPMEIEDEVIDNIIPFIQFKHNVWGKETVVEDLIKLTSEKEDIYVHMNKLYLCDDFYDSINNKGKSIVLYIYDGLFEILDAARLGNVKVVSIPSEFYKK